MPVRPAFVAVGDVMVDVVAAAFEPGGRVHAAVTVRPGGSASVAATAAVAAGADAAVVGRVADDPAGRLVVDGLTAAGVRPLLALDRQARTGAVVATPRGIVADRGANAFLVPVDVPDPLRADAVLVSGYVLLHDDSAPAGVAALRRAVARWRAVDVASAQLLQRCGAQRFFELADGANAVLATEEEAHVLTGATEATEAATLLADRFELACVKRGAAGAVAVVEGRVEQGSVRAVPGQGLGAGDAFGATLLVGLARGDELAAALAAACASGAAAAAVPAGTQS
jgi:sugar/nucleoside kinase (ribokinase family)